MKAEPVEHGFNGRSEVAVFVPPLPGAPLSWAPEGDAGVRVDTEGHPPVLLAISADVRGMADRDGRALLVEVDAATRSTRRVTALGRAGAGAVTVP